jgi:membrane protein insertase Oxa1/YidC/SpoIIIJ
MVVQKLFQILQKTYIKSAFNKKKNQKNQRTNLYFSWL